MTAIKILISVAGILTYGITLQIMWGWFITPLGLPEITISHAIGLALVALLFANGSEKEYDAFDVLEVIVKLVVLLGFGWVVSLFL